MGNRYAISRGWLSFVEGFGWLALILSVGTGALILVEAIELQISPAMRTFVAATLTLTSLSGGAVMIAFARVGQIICDLAEKQSSN